MADIDIEQVNKLRLAMGMKALPIPGAAPAPGPVFKESRDDGPEEEAASTLETREALAGENWKKVQDEQAAKVRRQAQKDAIKKARDAAQRFAKLEGKGLADENDEMDTKAWLLSHSKKQSKLEKARRLEKELAERDQQAQYTAADLSGVKVGHEIDQFDEAGEHILTLKDAAVDAESDDDELENVDMREREKLQERLDAKKKKPMYNPNEDDGGKILAQYDEEIDGKKRKRFTLDRQGTSKQAALDLEMEDGPVKSKGVKISLDILKDDAPVNDYREDKPVKIKKPKKGKSTKRKAFDDEDIFFIEPDATRDGNDVVMGDANSTNGSSNKRSLDNANFEDDGDIQTELAAQRRATLKKRKKMTPEELARQVREDEVADTIEAEEDVGLIIDETSEFVANLQKPEVPTSREVRAHRVSTRSPDVDGDIDIEKSYNDVGEERSQSRDLSRARSTPADTTTTGLEDEATLSKGIGTTFSMLTQRGILKTAASGDSAVYRDRMRFLSDNQKSGTDAELRARAQRERDRASGKLDRMSAREREEYARRTNAQRDQAEARQAAERFNREYKPDVTLKYSDDYGRSLGPKEAFKQMSHMFHGKGSGKQKTEKYMKKVEDEKRKEGMSVLDASQNSTNMNSAVGDRAKKNRTAGVRLQ